MTNPTWKNYRLSEIAKCQGGSAFSPNLQGRKEGDIPFYKVSDMNLPDNKWRMTKANNYISSAEINLISGAIKPAGSVIFPKVGAAIHTNKKRQLTCPAFVDNNLMAVWPIDPELCLPEFLYAFFLMHSLSEFANPGPLPSINGSQIQELEISLPRIQEQKGIALLLNEVQNALQLEEKQLVKLLLLKQATMRELFTRGLRGEAQKETQFGNVPQNWKVSPLESLAEIQTGAAKGRKFENEKVIEVPYLRVANVQDGHLDLREMKKIQIKANELERYRLKVGDVVLTEGGDFDKLGRGFIWRGELETCIHQNHVFAVRTNAEHMLPDFFAYLAQSPYGKSYFLKVAHKTTNLACINSNKLKAFPTLVPPIDEQRQIVSILEALDRKIALHNQKRIVLEELFKSLLHKLMRGEIRVSGLNLAALEAPSSQGAVG